LEKRVALIDRATHGVGAINGATRGAGMIENTTRGVGRSASGGVGAMHGAGGVVGASRGMERGARGGVETARGTGNGARQGAWGGGVIRSESRRESRSVGGEEPARENTSSSKTM
jgi:hypothetical protein